MDDTKPTADDLARDLEDDLRRLRGLGAGRILPIAEAAIRRARAVEAGVAELEAEVKRRREQVDCFAGLAADWNRLLNQADGRVEELEAAVRLAVRSFDPASGPSPDVCREAYCRLRDVLPKEDE